MLMTSFISETIQDILQNTASFENTIFIVPSKRSSVFIKHTLKEKVTIGFLPKIMTIEDFVSEVSEIKKIDSIQLLFHFYTIYKSLEENPDPFDVFASWAFTVLQDFNEIDQNLVKSQEIFTYLKDIQRLREWSVQGTFQETPLIKNYYKFLKKLNDYYDVFYTFLSNNKIGYQGVLYRETIKKIDRYTANHSKGKFFFMGFNALNKSEELLIQKLLSKGNTQIYWDIDKTFLNGNHQAGHFIRKYKKEWLFYQKNELKTVGDWFSKEKNIEVIGASKNITQIKYVGNLLKTLTDYQKTALVLADESLLPIALNSIPENIDAINITMGYPLKDVPMSNLFTTFFQLFLSQEKLQKTTQNLFYYKNVLQFIKHPLTYTLLSNTVTDKIASEILKENKTFVSQEYIVSFCSSLDKQTQKSITEIFKKYSSVDDFLQRIINFILLLKENANTINKEYLFRFYTVFVQLQNLQKTFGYFDGLKTLHLFFVQLLSSETLSFQGEPLQGLQVMGMLETRMLDFKNVILTSVNENILPTGTQQSSFIPLDVKDAFGLPTYKEKDAIFSYHFFRLLQRAKNIYLIYNTENDSFGKGEKSRFITQLALIQDTIKSKIISPNVHSEQSELQEIPKNELIEKKLKELATKGISPSALTNYLNNPINFYKQKILGIQAFEEVEEDVAFNTLGTVVHDTLDELYQPYIGAFLTADHITTMQQKTTKLVTKYFTEHFKNGNITIGKNKLIYEVAIRFVQNFLRQEKRLVSNESNRLKIIATEENYSTTIKLKGFDFPIKIHGQVDRVDELNGVTRIIDYKTGMVKETDLKVTDFEKIRDYKYSKAIQVLLYTYMYTKTKKITTIEAGIFSFKNLKKGFLQLNFSEKRGGFDVNVTQERLDMFISEIKELLLEIYTTKNPFKEPKNVYF